MKKTPSIFERDWDSPGQSHPVIDKVNPEVAWVFDPDVPKVATRKWDGTCVMFDGTDWWARREVKPGKLPPLEYLSLGEDPLTGKTMGWEPIEQSGWRKFHAEALLLTRLPDNAPPFAALQPLKPGTYELIGPSINGNPEGFTEHCLVSHANPGVLVVPSPLTFDAIREYMRDFPHEGIVWHEVGGQKRMAKIKRRDFYGG